MKYKYIIAAAAAALCFSSATVLAEGHKTYTFTGVNAVTDGSPNDVTDAKLTEELTVTTSGEMNRKYAAVTDLEHNKDVGTFPAKPEFKATGSYLYLGAASSNDNSIITLNMPEIPKGSRVELTFAKPTVTNNGSTLRNTGDPYAYFKIADRYISINGDNFDAWRTESVVTGEDTNTIEFHCDKWGAVAVSKIEISDGDGKPLHSLNISSTQFANLNVNGIKFYADSEGKLTVPSLPESEKVVVSAKKDGYITAETNVTIANGDTSVDIPLECEKDYTYYESDFGNAAGVLELDGAYGLNESLGEVTAVKGNVTFKENGSLAIKDGRDKVIVSIEYKPNGIYANDVFITSKDNMEFTAVIDKAINAVIFTQNGISAKLNIDLSSMKEIGGMEGHNTSIEYIGINYPDMSKVDISGVDEVYVTKNTAREEVYTITPEYKRPVTDIKLSVSGIAGAEIKENGTLILPPGASGTARICAEYNGAKNYKNVIVKSNPKIVEYTHEGRTLNLGASKQFTLTECIDELGGVVSPTLMNFKSSDENVIKVDDKGMMTAVGNGTAVISLDAYTGVSNPISVEYTVDNFYISGVTEGETTYISGELVNDEHITAYKVKYTDTTKSTDGGEEEVVPTEVPAAVAKADGTVVTLIYDNDGNLRASNSKLIKVGDKFLASNGNRNVYLYSGDTITKVTETESTMPGFVINHKDFAVFEIAPIYTFTNIGDVKEEGKTLDALFDGSRYKLTFKKAETKRGDIYVNGYMVGNNVDQADADRKVIDGALYTAEDIRVRDGSITVSMCDGSTMLDYVVAEKEPYFVRPRRIYVIGDSLACNYYGSFEKEVGGGRTGWGQVLSSYVNVPVTNLANSGQFAAGLYETAFPSVIENGEAGDILLLECAYNDRNYSTREEMTHCVKDMIRQCREKGIRPILVTPNASEHDYKPEVAWTSYLKDIAVDMECDCIDLSGLSYEYLHNLYGDNEGNVITKNFNLTEVGGDNLHTSYAGANVWASIVASELKKLGLEYMLTTDYEYTFTDTEGHEIVVKAK